MPRTSLTSVLVLAFDTATPAVTVALVRSADPTPRLLATSTVVDARRHGELLAPGIAAVLAAAGADRRDVDAVAVGVGPGPFTGLRVGVVTARALGAALEVPVHGVCTLDALALGADLPGRFLVATDARRREVFWAAYDGGQGASRRPRRLDGPRVSRPVDVPGQRVPVVGDGATLYPEALPDAREPRYPDAADIARWVLAGLPTVGAVPLYLRRPDAAEPGARKRVLA